ncbi:MAG: 6-phosphofructokinase [Elusimicrobia bacterium]|nr:6-phosphofructokinase [Candidatus Liberimonas magnetica]
MKRVAVITSGGDAPGMNTAIRAVVREAIYTGFDVLGIQHGYAGLLENQIIPLNTRSVSGIVNLGGTMLKTSRCQAIKTEAGIIKAVEILKSHCIDGIIGIGGDGSLCALERISRHGINGISIPASIDNDVFGTDETIGFDTATDTAIDAIDKIRDTAQSHERIFIVEVMGREHGFLALQIGIAAGAEFVLVPEIKYNIKKVCEELKKEVKKGKTSIIIIFAEGVGDPFVFSKEVQKATNLEVRVTALGYIQRGGSPSARSRVLASLFGSHAVKIFEKGKKNRLVVLKNGRISDVPYSQVIGKEKKINMELYGLIRHLAV